MYVNELRRLQAFDRTDTLYIVVWQSYNEWKATSPFASEADAKRHVERYLAEPGKDYNKLITIIPVPKPGIPT